MVGAILHGKDFTPVTRTAPAVPGETLSILATSLGSLQQRVVGRELPHQSTSADYCGSDGKPSGARRRRQVIPAWQRG